MTPKTVTPWAQTLLRRGERLEVVECWQLGGVYRCWFGRGVGFSTLCLNHHFDIVFVLSYLIKYFEET